MKLLFDQNLSRCLSGALCDLFPNSMHVRDVVLLGADGSIWYYAALQGCVLVTKDADFRQRGFLSGHPPKIVWSRLGSCWAGSISELMRHAVAGVFWRLVWRTRIRLSRSEDERITRLAGKHGVSTQGLLSRLKNLRYIHE